MGSLLLIGCFCWLACLEAAESRMVEQVFRR